MEGSSLRAWAKGSTTRASKSGDKGHPCQVPLDRETNSEKCPLTLNYATGAE